MQKLFCDDFRSLSGQSPWLDFKGAHEIECKILYLFACVHISRRTVQSLHHIIERTPWSKTMWGSQIWAFIQVSKLTLPKHEATIWLGSYKYGYWIPETGVEVHHLWVVYLWAVYSSFLISCLLPAIEKK